MQAILKARQAEQEKGNAIAPTPKVSPILTDTGETQPSFFTEPATDPDAPAVNPLKAV